MSGCMVHESGCIIYWHKESDGFYGRVYFHGLKLGSVMRYSYEDMLSYLLSLIQAH